MDDQQALKILTVLANGAHPITGEIFADDSPYQSVTIIRALFTAIRALENGREAGKAPSNSNNAVDSNLVDSNLADSNSVGLNSAKAEGAEKNSKSRSNIGKPWSSEEDQALLAAFDAQQPIATLAKKHGRTQNGVRARLEKHGRLPPTEARWSQSPKAASQVRDVGYSS